VKLVTFAVAATAALICADTAKAGDPHPIVKVKSWYLFGATSHDKWIKAEEAAKLPPAEATYRVYGLTQAFGEARGRKPHKVSIQSGISAGLLGTN
jgi:hypothetical protein